MLGVKWPTTLILLGALGGTTFLAFADKIDGAAVTSLYGTIIGAVTVGHYVKTINGSLGGGLPPEGTTTSTTISRTNVRDEGP